MTFSSEISAPVSRLARLLAAVSLLVITGCSTFSGQVSQQAVTFVERPVPLEASLFLPQRSSAKVPAVVVVHGGSWVRRSGDMESISQQLAEAGLAAFNITYRSAEQFPYPAAVNDVNAAIEWLRNNAEQYGIDANRIGGWGYSAGGQLILRAGLNPSAGLNAIVSGGTPAKFSFWPESPVITRFIGASYQDAPAIWEDASPINHIQPGSPAVFMYHGERDTLVDPIQMTLMSDALLDQQVEVTTYLLENRGHFGTYLFGGEAEQEAIQFLKQRL